MRSIGVGVGVGGGRIGEGFGEGGGGVKECTEGLCSQLNIQFTIDP